jgi:hypothetical protein
MCDYETFGWLLDVAKKLVLMDAHNFGRRAPAFKHEVVCGKIRKEFPLKKT